MGEAHGVGRPWLWAPVSTATQDEGRGKLRTARGFGFAILLLYSSLSAAQDFPPQFQLAPVTEAPQLTATSAIDLESVVTSAAKRATTVQEAAAIVTIITAED